MEKHGKMVSDPIELGDCVWYKIPFTYKSKLAPCWVDKGIVIDKKFESYKVLTSEGKTIVANRRFVKKL